MNQTQVFNIWYTQHAGQVIGDGQCVAAIRSYLSAAYPGINSFSILPSVTGAKQLANHSSPYLQWIPNNHADVNQVPVAGDIMVFDATPQSGYTNTSNNKYGHTGICASASPSGYVLAQQNAPHNGSALNEAEYDWKFRPCLGWYHLINLPTETVTITMKPKLWNVRSGPGTNYPVAVPGQVAKQGETYQAVIQDNGWAQIQFQGKVGYVASNSYDK